MLHANDRVGLSWKTIRRIAGLIGLIFAFASPGEAHGYDHSAFGWHETVIVAEGERIRQDYFAFGKRIEILGIVEGDLYAVGSEVLIRGEVMGDLLIAAGDLVISGRIGQDVRLVGGEAKITGEIGGSVTAAAVEIRMDSAARVHGAVAAAGQRVSVAGEVARDTRLAGSDVALTGRVGGNLRAVGGKLEIGPDATVAGGFSYWSERDATIIPGARLGGPVEKRPIPAPFRFSMERVFKGIIAAMLILKLVSLVSTWIAGVLMIYLFPGFLVSAVQTIRQQPFRSFGLGIGLVVGIPILILTLLVSVVGFPLGLVIAMVSVAIVFLSRVLVIVWVGSAIVGWWGGKSQGIWALTLGLLIYGGLTLIPIIGGIAALLAVVIGLGAGLVVIRDLRGSSLGAPNRAF